LFEELPELEPRKKESFLNQLELKRKDLIDELKDRGIWKLELIAGVESPTLGLQ